MSEIPLSQLIAPTFYYVHEDIMEERYTHYMLKGGRGSTKSSFISIEIILGMMKNSDVHAVALRKVGVNLKDSVFAQLEWAIEKLGVSDKWAVRMSPLQLIYKKTKQKIIFRGADDPQKIKSLKFPTGYPRYIWYEELAEFGGMAEIRSINQSLMRGGRKFDVFYSYNPPESISNWVNQEAAINNPGRLVHASTYLDVPRDWLGEQFITEAEHLRTVNPKKYAHEYLGKATGTGGEVFANIKPEEITDEQIKSFDKIYRGIDFGYAADPFVYTVCYYDKTRRRLYIFDEIYKVGMSNMHAAEEIHKHGEYKSLIICDSAEPKSIAELRGYNLRVSGARKGPDSVEYGIKFLQSLEQIIIDTARCPNTFKEFSEYELEKDKNDGFKDGYPDKNNHTIDAVRYALESEITNKKARILKRGDFF